MEIFLKYQFLTYLYDNIWPFRFIYEHDKLTLIALGAITLVCILRGWYVPMLIASILLLFFNCYFLVDIPSLSWGALFISWSDYLFLRVVTVFIGIWGIYRYFHKGAGEWLTGGTRV
jgi:hypothetical protein